MNVTRTVGVSRAWRTIALGLSAGVTAHALLSLRRPAVVDPTMVVTVRDVATAAAADPRLDRVLDAVDFDGVPLFDVFRSLADRGGVNVLPDWARLDDVVGVRPNAPVTLHLKAVRWSSALDAALLSVDPKHKTGWNLHADTVSVSAGGGEFAGPLCVRLYDVEPLLAIAARQRVHPVATSGFYSGPGNGVQGSGNSNMGSEDDLMDELKRYIEDTVDPNGWKDNGGDVGSISTYGAELIVTQTEQNQRRVAAALALLAERR